jgi:hypothetical protein
MSNADDKDPTKQELPETDADLTEDELASVVGGIFTIAGNFGASKTGGTYLNATTFS